ncbi:MAG TPA: IS30 family transposase, partial [Gammaproteobacteria bacterium]|nr:IS30 family transposase [Gammaproteobacteria bacterium]
RRTLTSDRGIEMASHERFSLATQMQVYFCYPYSPRQRGSNENTNGLLRQYFPKRADLSVHSQEHLDMIAARLNGRPRQTLNWHCPAEALDATVVASTGRKRTCAPTVWEGLLRRRPRNCDAGRPTE